MITAFIKTYGCQANVADSAAIEKYLIGLGCSIVDFEADADLIIVNSCAIREKAEHKMASYVGEIMAHKKEKPYMAIGIIGCVASYRKQELMERFELLNFVFSARDDLQHFRAYTTNLIESIATEKNLYYADRDKYKPIRRRDKNIVDFVARKKLQVVVDKDLKVVKRGGLLRSMINIMRGCNNYCSYCIVPFTKGRERSFSMASIVAQVERDVAAGAKEITLLGQNVNSYKDPEMGATFATLLERVASIPGEFWVRFVSPHPKDMTNDVIDVIAKYPEKLCSFIHLPLQSGSDKILEAMNRTYSVEKFLHQVEQIKKRLPHVTLTTDIIVGFPGETEEDYQGTRDVMEKVRFNTIFSFVYSPRKYTKAAELEDLCSQEVKLQRLKRLQVRQREIGTEQNRALIGKTFKILIEEKLSDGRLWGRTEGNIKMFFPAAESEKYPQVGPNCFVFATVKDAQMTDLTGEIENLPFK